MNKDKKKRKKKEAKEWYKKIYDIRSKSAESFDKLLVYLSAGALVLTIGFVKDFVLIDKNTDTSFLIISWVLFGFSLLTMLLSHKTTIISMDYELDKKRKTSDKWDIVTEILNWTSIISLISGIIFFIIFTSKKF